MDAQYKSLGFSFYFYNIQRKLIFNFYNIIH